MSQAPSKASQGAVNSAGANKKKTGKDKRKKFMKAQKKTPMEKQKMTWGPPKDTQQFSSNWKNLLEIMKSNPDNSKQKEPQKTNPNGKKDNLQKRKAKDSAKPEQTPGSDTKQNQGPTKSFKNDRGGEAGKAENKANKRKVNGSLPESNKQVTKKRKIEEPAEKKPTEEDLWFDDVDPDDIETAVGQEAADIVRRRTGVKPTDAQSTEKALVKEHCFEGVTRAVAMDCEMVGVGPEGEESILARCSMVNQFGKCIYDKFVRPTERVTDYRTAVSGIRPDDIREGEDFKIVQKEVAEILDGRVLVGHAIHNDLKVLLLDHPKKKIRDTQKYKPFRKLVRSGRPSLKVLSREILNVKVQQGEHSSVQDAQATMRLYTMVKKDWEKYVKEGKLHGVAEREKAIRKPRAPKKKMTTVQANTVIAL
ncbi:RNA exonuclease 4 [Engraulis encrasicolus]|uniref:RNA exonuclease 4 n=1 Tax=Engraulis encrasicolus TaxID=184585 RepID=UPI002FCEC0F5